MTIVVGRVERGGAFLILAGVCQRPSRRSMVGEQEQDFRVVGQGRAGGRQFGAGLGVVVFAAVEPERVGEVRFPEVGLQAQRCRGGVFLRGEPCRGRVEARVVRVRCWPWRRDSRRGRNRRRARWPRRSGARPGAGSRASPASADRWRLAPWRAGRGRTRRGRRWAGCRWRLSRRRTASRAGWRRCVRRSRSGWRRCPPALVVVFGPDDSPSLRASRSVAVTRTCPRDALDAALPAGG